MKTVSKLLLFKKFTHYLVAGFFCFILVILASQTLINSTKIANANDLFGEQTGSFFDDLTGEQTGVISGDLIGEQTGVITDELVGEQTGIIVEDLVGEQTGTIPCEVKEEFPQCGGTLGLESKDPTHTFMVTRVRDCNGNVIGYKSSDLGNLGQCAATPVCRDIRTEFPQCGGTVGLEGFPATDTILVAKFTDSCTGAERFGVVRNLGNLGQCAAAPTPIPTAIPTPIPTRVPTPTPIIVTPTPVVVTPTPTPVVIVPTAIPTPTPMVIIPTIIPAGGPVNTVQCQAGFDQRIVDSNIICVQQVQNQTQTQSSTSTSSATTAPINVTVTAPAQVAGVTVTKAEVLPVTGLPMAAWAMSGFLPLGAGLKRFGRFGKSSKDTARYLWQEREFLRS